VIITAAAKTLDLTRPILMGILGHIDDYDEARSIIARLLAALPVWTAAQTAQFLHHISDHRLYAAYHLIALRGLRRGEAAGLRWCDLDLDNRVAVINSQSPAGRRQARAGTAQDQGQPTNHRPGPHHRRGVPSASPAEPTALDRDGGGYVFTNVGGRPITPERLSINFGKLVAASGLPPIRLHDLRHGAASLALQAGADLKVVQDQLGHSSIVLTADTYTSVLPEVARASAEDVARLIMTAARHAPGSPRPRRRATRPTARVQSTPPHRQALCHR
jgi:integrase